jgi:hypothetical protein
MLGLRPARGRLPQIAGSARSGGDTDQRKRRIQRRGAVAQRRKKAQRGLLSHFPSFELLRKTKIDSPRSLEARSRIFAPLRLCAFALIPDLHLLRRSSPAGATSTSTTAASPAHGPHRPRPPSLSAPTRRNARYALADARCPRSPQRAARPARRGARGRAGPSWLSSARARARARARAGTGSPGFRRGSTRKRSPVTTLSPELSLAPSPVIGLSLGVDPRMDPGARVFGGPQHHFAPGDRVSAAVDPRREPGNRVLAGGRTPDGARSPGSRWRWTPAGPGHRASVRPGALVTLLTGTLGDT